MSTLYLHIGTPKTGTTALQNFFPHNKEVLEKFGICYPDFGYRYPGLGIHRNAHFMVAHRYDEDGNADVARDQAEWTAAFDTIQQLLTQYDKVLVSDEGLWKGAFSQEGRWQMIKDALAERKIDTKIIVYFRRQDLWVQSHFSQKVKEGATYDFKGYLKEPVFTGYPLDYAKYLDMLSDLFGKENIIVRVYEKQSYAGEEKTIFSDFLDIFGLKMSDGFEVAKAIHNTSLVGDCLEIKRIMNVIPELKNNKHVLIAEMKRMQEENVFPNINKKLTYFDEGGQQEFMKRYASSNERVAKEYLYREDGVLFQQPVKTKKKYDTELENIVTDVTLLYAQMFDRQEKKNAEQNKQINKLKQEVALLKEKNSELKKEYKKELNAAVKEIQQDLIWFRLKRKIRHLLGRDKK